MRTPFDVPLFYCSNLAEGVAFKDTILFEELCCDRKFIAQSATPGVLSTREMV